ncbi:unnamed protein product, partial [Didymodactylos carnosus]
NLFVKPFDSTVIYPIFDHIINTKESPPSNDLESTMDRRSQMQRFVINGLYPSDELLKTHDNQSIKDFQSPSFLSKLYNKAKSAFSTVVFKKPSDPFLHLIEKRQKSKQNYSSWYLSLKKKAKRFKKYNCKYAKTMNTGVWSTRYSEKGLVHNLCVIYYQLNMNGQAPFYAGENKMRQRLLDVYHRKYNFKKRCPVEDLDMLVNFFKN